MARPQSEQIGKITLTAVASQAGVSVGTASMALAGDPRLSPETAQHVQAVAQRLGYVPLRRRTSKAGRNAAPLITAEQSLIAMIGLDIDYGRFPVYARLLQIVGEAASQRKHRLISPVVRTHEEAQRIVEESGAAGALLLWQDPHEGRIDVAALQKKLPCVRVMGTSAPGSTVDHVTFDNRRVGELAAEYLWKRGHRVAVVVHYDQWLGTMFLNRSRAFVERFEHLGGKATVFKFRGNIQAQEVATAIAGLEPRPTGIFANDDGVLSQFDLLLRHVGMVHGQNIEMIGCNNETHRLDEISPRPASIDLQLTTLVEQAFELMYWRQNNRGTPRMQVMVEPKLAAAIGSHTPLTAGI